MNTTPRGFTLIELAICMFVITLVLGMLMKPMTSLYEQRKILDTRKSLDEISQALIGFAMVNGRLPCPDTDTDPTAPGYGKEEPICNVNPAAEGFLPTVTIGLQSTTDEFGNRFRYRVDRNFAVAFTLSTICHPLDQFTIVQTMPDGTKAPLHGTTGWLDQAHLLICNRPATGSCDCPFDPPSRPVAIVFSTGANGIPDGENATFEATLPVYQSDIHTNAYDDQTIWIGQPTLKGALVRAQKLP